MGGATGAIAVHSTLAHPHGPSSLEWVAYLAPSLLALLGGVWIMVHIARHGGESGDDPGEDDGGGGGGRRPKPPDPRPEFDPSWWPEFERQFAAYAQSRGQPTGVKSPRSARTSSPA
jgi:hypothetical protein